MKTATNKFESFFYKNYFHFSVGSSLRNAGQFEIRKNEDPDQKPIEVIIAGDLSGESRIQIDIESSKLQYIWWSE